MQWMGWVEPSRVMVSAQAQSQLVSPKEHSLRGLRSPPGCRGTTSPVLLRFTAEGQGWFCSLIFAEQPRMRHFSVNPCPWVLLL